ncbi:MAG: SdrD B-like domain-containing protein [Chloroflexota bacterium]
MKRYTHQQNDAGDGAAPNQRRTSPLSPALLVALSLLLAMGMNLFNPTSLLAQDPLWAGTVVDEVGNPLDATVSINGHSVQANDDGTFEVDVPLAADSRYVINVNKFGYVPFSHIHVGVAIESLNIQLKEAQRIDLVGIDANGMVSLENRNGARIDINANELVDENGNPARVPLQLLFYSYNILEEAMVGDMSGLNAAGELVALETYGAFYAEFIDADGNIYNLADNATAQISIPLVDGIEAVSTVPLWSYNAELGLWIQEGRATLQDGRYVGQVSHFSVWNFDVEKQEPACIRLTVDPVYLALNTPIQVRAVLLSPVRVRNLNLTQTTNVLYNLPANTDVEFYLPPTAPTPFATVNTGAPWGGTGVPPQPYTVCNGSLHIDESSTKGIIQGIKYHDLNGNGARDAGEPGLEGWTIVAIHADGTVHTATTDVNGAYEFADMEPGLYRVREEWQPGWVQTEPEGVYHHFSLAAGETVEGIDFGNTKPCDNPETDSCIAGVNDDFDLSNGVESSTPSAALLAEAASRGWPVLTQFDVTIINRFFLHTFGASSTDTCLSGDCVITNARFVTQLKAGPSSLVSNDTIGFMQNGAIIWSARISSLPGVGGSWTPGDMATISLDLANLPPNALGVTNILAALQDGDLDVFVQDDTAVDTMELHTEKCCGEDCINPPDDMSAWWPLDEVTGSIAADIAGFSDDGTHVNGPTPIVGMVSNALRFNGQNYVEAATSPELNVGEGDFSIDAWVRTHDANGVKIIVDKRYEDGVADTQGYSLFLVNGRVGFQMADGSGSWACSSDPVSSSCTNYISSASVADGEWHLVAVTVDRDQTDGGKIYVDGSLVHTFNPTIRANSLDNRRPLRIASRSSSRTGLFRGDIDEVELFKRALTADEVVGIYRAGSEGKCKDDTRKGQIHGMKFHDVNGNGVKDVGESGLPGWTIVIENAVGGVMNAVTDVNGEYWFMGLPADTYTLTEVLQPGWIQTFPATGVHAMSLLNGAVANGVDFGNTREPGGGEIYGIKFHDLNGNGVQDPGEPVIPGWTIHLYGPNGNIIATTTTDADGVYCFMDLDPGFYIVREEMPDGWTHTFPDAGFYEVQLGNGQVIEGLDFGNQREPGGSIYGIKFYDRNGNGVQDADEPVIPGWTINLYDENGDIIATTTTDENGVYCFMGLPAGFYVVGEEVPDGWEQTFPTSEVYEVQLDSGQVIEGLDFGNRRVPDGGSIYGVKFEDLNGNGEWDDGEPVIPGWPIYLYDAAGNIIAETKTDENGVYCFMNLPPGLYIVGEEHPVGWVQTFPDTEVHEVQLGNGQVIEGLNFGNMREPDGGEIYGVKFNDLNGNGAWDSDEPPIEGWIITLYDAAGNLIGETKTDENGVYCFMDLPPGLYTVAEEQVAGWIQTSPSTEVYEVQVGNGQVIEDLNFGNMEDPDGGSIYGVKFHDLNGNGEQDSDEPVIPGWPIYLYDAAGNLIGKTVTDENGVYCFMNLPPGPYIVEEGMQDGWVQTFPDSGVHQVDLEPGQQVDGLNFGNMRAPGSIHGVKFHDLNGNGVWDSNEPTLPNWTINLYDAAGNVIATTTTDEDGVYCFMGLSPGFYVVGEEQQQGWVQTVPASEVYQVQLGSGQVIEGLHFGNRRESDGGEIHGMKFDDLNGNGVKDPDEPGLAGWTILLVNSAGEVLSATTDADGNYWFIGLPAGVYTVVEVIQPGWTQTYPLLGGHVITVGDGDVIEGIDFGNLRKDGEWCHVGWDINVFNDDVNTVEVGMNIVNNSGANATYTVNVVGSPGFTINGFTTTPPAPIAVPDGGIQYVMVFMSPLPTFTGPSGLYHVIVTNDATGQSFGCSAQLWQSDLLGVAPLGGVLIQDLPPLIPQELVFELHNQGNQDLLVPIEIVDMFGLPGQELPLIRLDGLPPGEPVLREVLVPAGEIVEVPVMVELLETVPNSMGDIILFADVDGDSAPEAASSIIVVPAVHDQPMVYISPESGTVNVSDRYTANVQIDNVVNLYGLQIELAFDPALVGIVDPFEFLPGIQILPGDFLPPEVTIQNIVDMDNGLINYAISLEGVQPGVSGSGLLAQVVFEGLISGTTPISLTHVVLSDPDSQSIAHTTRDGQLTVEEVDPLIDIRGRVILERRDSNAGAQVCIGDQCILTEADGLFAFENMLPEGTVHVSHPSYLRASYDYVGTPGSGLTLPIVTLLGGDINQDDDIDIIDGVLIGLAWNSTPSDSHWSPNADINDDGVVNVQDRVAVAFNWLQSAPGPWDDVVASGQSLFNLGIYRPASLLISDASAAQLTLSPAQTTIDVLGEATEVDIAVEDVTNLYGFSIELSFDPTSIQVKDINPIEDGTQIRVGEFLDVLNQQVLVNRVDNDAGTIELAVTQTHPTTAKEGSGVLGTIEFEGIANGQSSIQFSSIQLVDDVASAFAPNETVESSIQVGVPTQTQDSLLYLPLIAR